MSDYDPFLNHKFTWWQILLIIVLYPFVLAWNVVQKIMGRS